VKRFLILLGLTLMAVSCDSATDIPVGDDVSVELDAFSGRPNPTWSLNGPEVAELRSRLAGLPAAPGQTVPEGGLGYRGFRVRLRGEGSSPEESVYVAKGLVSRGANGQVYRDTHDLEGWLRENARARGYPVPPPGEEAKP
jgi:hypothetical protein